MLNHQLRLTFLLSTEQLRQQVALKHIGHINQLMFDVIDYKPFGVARGVYQLSYINTSS